VSDCKSEDSTVDHPQHYNVHPSGVECIQIVEWLTFNVGNAVKYAWRAGLKDKSTAIEDLRKAAWYLNREIDRLEKMKSTPDSDFQADNWKKRRAQRSG
jgi:hypothetical protein